jgi:RND superfamily putative drug exporter
MLSHIMSVSNITPPLTELMVLGVGVDYALFIVTRHRRNLRRGMSVRDSIVAAINTSGRAVLFAGTTVCIAMLGLTALGVSFFIAAVVGLSFLLLMIAFRSLLVPMTAAAMNLLAAGASFGIVVAIFQWGWFAEALGIGKGGPIEAWAPVMAFAIIFGLSMDYQVFLVSRMHEEWVHTHDNRRAVKVGQAATGGIITAAAAIMIAVFLGFVLDPNRAVKLFGVGLAGAVLIDAFILRTVLVPSLMHMFGRANWAFPRWLDRITPRVSVEPADSVDPSVDPHDRPERELARV